MRRVNSYDTDARLPKIGTRWMWEIDKAHARELIEVIEVFWNGEEWWVLTKTLLPNWSIPPSTGAHLNDLSRFWEAVTPVGGSMHGLIEHREPQ